jgi:hypothetical protein
LRFWSILWPFFLINLKTAQNGCHSNALLVNL